MKLDLSGVFSRLNPANLIAKFKAKRNDDDDDLLKEDEDLFGDLGDLDQIESDAAEREAEAAENDFDDFDDDSRDDDFDTDDHDDFDDLDGHPDNMAADHLGDLDAGFDDAPDPGDELVTDMSADAIVEDALGDLGEIDLGSAFDDDEDAEDDEAAQKAKLKKLLMMAGGGVAAAVLLGGVTWWVLGGDDVAEADMAADQSGAATPGGLVIDLDEVPPFADDTPIPGTQSQPASSARTGSMSQAETGTGLALPTASQDTSSGSPPAQVGGEVAELQQLGLYAQVEPGVGVVIPSTTKASYGDVPAWPAAEPLREAPFLTLVQQGEHGLLPVIGKDGDTSYDAYSRPEPTEKSDNPKIAIIVTGLGMSRAATEAAIATMPADVTLSLDVYARGLDFWVRRARNAGHEVLLNMPGEAVDFPFSDPGPNALMSLVPPDQNIEQLEWILSRTTGYFGVLSVYGSKFLTIEEQVNAVMEQLKRRGLMYVDGGAQDSLGTRVAYAAGLKWATVEITLDSSPGRKILERQLQAFEDLAKKRAVAIARVSADPGTLAVLSVWLRDVQERGLQLVPVSSLANKQLIR